MITLAQLPELRAQIHPDLNDETIDFDSISAKSKTKAWWLGKCNHAWETTVANRFSGTGCPICAGQKVLEGFNDFKTFFPELATEWHPVLNGILKATEFTKGSNKKVWWLGSCGHEWEQAISNRAKGAGCLVCAGKIVLQGFNDLASKHPAVAELWHPTKNDGILPTQVTPSSNKTVWWLGKCGHEWDTKVSELTRPTGRGCPICSGKRILPGFNDLASSNFRLAAEWDFQKNGTLLPNAVAAKSGLKVWWFGLCGHGWQATVLSRHQGNGCPYCSGNIVLPGFNDLSTTHPDVAAEWDYSQNSIELSPSLVSAGTHQKVWWKSSCGHSWEASITNRTSKGRGCPYCANQKVIIGFNDAETTHASLQNEWNSTKNEKKLSDYTYGSGKKLWWICLKNHEWEATLKDRTRKDSTGCPFCASAMFVSKAEQEIADFLRSKGLVVEQSERTILSGMEIDVYLPDLLFGIEFNGLYWHSEDAGKGPKYHYNKWLVAKDKGIQLIQIWEDEWKKDSDKVKSMILHKIGMSNQAKVFARKTYVSHVGKNEIEAFLDKNHIQGYSSGSYYLGLFEKGTDELVSALVLLKEKGTNDDNLSIVRYATSKNVVGGFTKMMSYVESNIPVKRFVTFSDHCVSDGGLYANNGFTADKTLAPDYMYVVSNKRKHKFGYRLKKFKDDPNLLWQEGLTEKELAKLNNIPRIWDAGKTRWIKNLTSDR